MQDQKQKTNRMDNSFASFDFAAFREELRDEYASISEEGFVREERNLERYILQLQRGLPSMEDIRDETLDVDLEYAEEQSFEIAKLQTRIGILREAWPHRATPVSERTGLRPITSADSDQASAPRPEPSAPADQTPVLTYWAKKWGEDISEAKDNGKISGELKWFLYLWHDNTVAFRATDQPLTTNASLYRRMAQQLLGKKRTDESEEDYTKRIEDVVERYRSMLYRIRTDLLETGDQINVKNQSGINFAEAIRIAGLHETPRLRGSALVRRGEVLLHDDTSKAEIKVTS